MTARPIAARSPGGVSCPARPSTIPSAAAASFSSRNWVALAMAVALDSRIRPSRSAALVPGSRASSWYAMAIRSAAVSCDSASAQASSRTSELHPTPAAGRSPQPPSPRRPSPGPAGRASARPARLPSRRPATSSAGSPPPGRRPRRPSPGHWTVSLRGVLSSGPSFPRSCGAGVRVPWGELVTVLFCGAPAAPSLPRQSGAAFPGSGVLCAEAFLRLLPPGSARCPADRRPGPGRRRMNSATAASLRAATCASTRCQRADHADDLVVGRRPGSGRPPQRPPRRTRPARPGSPARLRPARTPTRTPPPGWHAHPGTTPPTPDCPGRGSPAPRRPTRTRHRRPSGPRYAASRGFGRRDLPRLRDHRVGVPRNPSRPGRPPDPDQPTPPHPRRPPPSPPSPRRPASPGWARER